MTFFTIRKSTFALAVSAISIFSFSNAGHAGFEWVPSEANIAPPPVIYQTPQALPFETISRDPVPVAPLAPAETFPVRAAPLAAPAPLPIVSAPIHAPQPVISMQEPLPLMQRPEPNYSHTPRRNAVVPAPIVFDNVPAQEPVMVDLTQPPAVPFNNAGPIFDAPPPTEAFVKPEYSYEPRRTKLVVPDDAPVFPMPNLDAPKRLSISASPQIDRNPSDVVPIQSGTIAPYAAPLAPAPVMMDIADGFGSDVPLALALRQIVPPAFAFSFAPGVNPGSRISWNGGKPWNDVVSDMVAPLGYGLFIQGKTVLITPNRTAQAIIPAAPVASYEAAIRTSDSFFNAPSLVEPAAGHPVDMVEAVLSPRVSAPSATQQPIAITSVQDIQAVEAVRPREARRISIQDPGQVPSNQPRRQSMTSASNEVVAFDRVQFDGNAR